MLPRINRLQKNKDFNKVFKKGKGFREDFLFLKILDNNYGVSRFGFVVSNKISNKSTVRNKIKRKLRNLVREKLPGIKKGMDLVIIVNHQINEKEFREMEKTLNKLFLKSNIL